MARAIHFLLLSAIALWLGAVKTTGARLLLQTTPTVARVNFTGPGGITLQAVEYRPTGFSAATNLPAAVLMHGCSGIWSNRIVGATNSNGTPNLQNNTEKWGLKLASAGAVALVVDSYTSRGLLTATEQNQCGGDSVVNPYTDRVNDARFAYDYLVGLPGPSGGATRKVNASRVGLLGWSNGAQSVMVESGATPRDDSTLMRTAASLRFLCFVAFYPGCGTNLGFGTTIPGSFWRPYAPMRLQVGSADGLCPDCKSRATTAQVTYAASSLVFKNYTDALHSFDNTWQIWPTSKCAPPPAEPVGDECSMRAADIDSFDFLGMQLGLIP